ncbi:isochorismatase family protein [Aureimonas fodinaquatilis]|uniref:Isochorismatase family protein n=1 Tax=Aureimonas fodinaquatilis TaxID=2565783 RepID=A0A5B0DWK4_9HYPH|nr:isochorismatase family protein [Aureimonas fodinaquatilis]KAA0970876.1 isochorismatase family protein [Aureimonas fodinaquatilis]
MSFALGSADLQRKGFAGRSGVGARPALIVIDFTRAFTDPQHRLGSDAQREIAATNDVIAQFRSKGLPVIFTAIEYGTAAQAAASNWRLKIEGIVSLYSGSPDTVQDDRLAREPTDPIINKQFASAFFRTDLEELLNSLAVDTVVLAGCSTSGCVRATAVDACQLGFKTIVCREAVADRDRTAHEQALVDIDLKYGDVLSGKEVADSLKTK